jgi:FixJ family two-component response regulator
LIAVIDDDDPFRTALVESLNSLEYEAKGFASAEDFVTAGGYLACDCVITDFHLPGMSGLDLMRLLAVLDAWVPVIVITARQDPDLAARVAAGGAACLLKKPFETAALLECLGRALGA